MSDTVVVRFRAGRHELVARRRLLVEANRFLRALELRGLSPKTLRAYAYDFVILYRWLADTQRRLGDLGADDLLEYIAAQRDAGAQPSTINRRLTTCRLLYRFTVGKDLTSTRFSPAPHYRGRGRDRHLGLHSLPRQTRLMLRVKTPRRVVEPLTVVEVRKFLRTLRRYRDLALVHLMLLCGLRSMEVLQLTVSDVALDTRELRVRGKGSKERMLPLPGLVVQVLRDYLQWERPARAKGDELFVVLQGRQLGASMTQAGLRNIFRHRRRTRRDLARANPHRFRHTFGADMARARVRLPILQRMMGHEHGRTTLQYIHLSMADIADEYQRAIHEIEKRYRQK